MRRVCYVVILFIASSPLLAENAFVRTLGSEWLSIEPGQIVEVERRELVSVFTPLLATKQGNFYIAKWDSAGNLMWQRTYYDLPINLAYAIEPTTNGNLMFGVSASLGTILIGEIDDEGKILWINQYSGWSQDYVVLPRDFLPEGAIESEIDILCGHLYTWDCLGPFTIMAYHYASGNILWANDYLFSLPQPIPVSAHSFDRTLDGGFIVTGVACIEETQSDIALLRLDPSGNPLWAVFLGGPLNEYPGDVVQLYDGTFLVVGETESFGMDCDILLAVVDDNGVLLWSRYIPNPGWDIATSAIPLMLPPESKQEPLAIVAGQIETLAEEEKQFGVNSLLFQICPLGICWSYLLFSPDEPSWNNGAVEIIRTDDAGYAVSGYGEILGFPDLMIAKWSEKRCTYEGGLTCVGDFIDLVWEDAPVEVTYPLVTFVPFTPFTAPFPLSSDSSYLLETRVCTWICGDTNGDEVVNSADLSYLANYLFFGGPGPVHPLDPNEDGEWNSADLSFLANYLFFGGPPPCSGYIHP